MSFATFSIFGRATTNYLEKQGSCGCYYIIKVNSSYHSIGNLKKQELHCLCYPNNKNIDFSLHIKDKFLSINGYITSYISNDNELGSITLVISDIVVLDEDEKKSDEDEWENLPF